MVPHETSEIQHSISMDAASFHPGRGGAARQRRLEKLRTLRRPSYANSVDEDGSTSDDSLSSASSSTFPRGATSLCSSSKSKKLSKEEEKRRKLEARKIRNRESAALSRKRKADLIADLEARVATLEAENRCLLRLVAARGMSHSNPTPCLEGAVAQRSNICKPAAFVF